VIPLQSNESAPGRSASDERVVVVGGGPVGYTVALILAQRGIPFVLLEAGDRVFDEPRAGTIHPPTLELYDTIGAARPMIDRGFVVSNYKYWDRTQGQIAEFDLSTLADETSFPYRLMLEQHKVCYVLQELLQAHGDHEIRLNHRVESVTQDAEYATLTVETPTGTETMRARYVIGCDGGRSQVRKSMDVDFEGFTYDERFLILSTPYDFGELGYAFTNYIADPVAWRALFKVPGNDERGLWRVVSPVDPTVSEAELFEESAVQARLQDFHAIDGDYEVVHRNVYNVHQRVASRFRDGRLLLAGDSAHINNPLGGMGMNFGVHDAFNLVEKLAQVWSGDAGEELLDQYDRQRRTVTQDYLQRQTIENKKNIGLRDADEREKFYAGMRETVADPELLRAYLRRVAMIEGFERSLAIP
jgi:3-(3-hydroxy-phenyl)propionate hydroxylase